MMEFINNSLDVILAILGLLGIGGASYYVYTRITKVAVRGDKNVVIGNGNDNVVIGNDNKIADSFNKKN